MSESDDNVFLQYQQGFSHRLDQILLKTEDNQVYYYQHADSESARLAHYMSKLGLKPGDRVSVQVEKSPQVLWLYLACLRGGFVFHPLNTAYQRTELAYFIEDAEPSLIICKPEKETLMAELTTKARAVKVLTLDETGCGSLVQGAQQVSADFPIVPRAAEHLAALLYSSGTTGRPKGIMLSHANLASNAKALKDCWGFSAGDRLLHALPVYHVHGLFVALGCVFCSGASMRWLPSFKSSQVINYLPECTVMMGVPTYYTRLLNDPDFNAEVCSQVRLFISGSAPLLEDTFKQFEARTGKAIVERYGMSETNINTSNPLRGERKAGTVGLPLPGVELRVVDKSGVVPVGQVGDLQVKGPNVFKGYWRMPQKTAEDFTSEGFFNTGDKACVDQDGYVTIVGRSKDMIITGGLNVYPKEVELLIDTLPGVLESAVIGVPDADLGERVIAVVVMREGAAVSAQQAHLALKGQVAGFKIPKSIELIDQLPRNAMGKVQKNILRQRFSESVYNRETQ